VKRSAALTGLSRDHHQALAVALRLRRATDETAPDAVAGFQRFLADAGRDHFALEEQHVLPALPSTDAEWAPAVDRVLQDHAAIRNLADTLPAAEDPALCARARELGELLTAHVRFEERELFELLERRLAPEELERVGRRLAGDRGD
jgi:hemerythrin-like domain-containing protein